MIFNMKWFADQECRGR